MKKLLFSIALTSAVYAYSQSLAYYQLPAPGTSSSVYNNSNNMRNIIYGKTPPNFNGKTLVFIHGFSSTSSTFLLDNDMYKEAYKAGYKTAFVSATKGEGDWVNGEILSRAIDQIKTYLGTSTVTIVAHSNGGKASEVAMFEYNKASSVDKVVTLSTPFRGTQIADVASSPAISWLVNLLGLGTGASFSTTYYCDSYFRPYFDNKSNNLPKKFFDVGAWGYARFFGDTSYAMIPAGGIIYAAGGGKNDGVTPFYSSTRPGGKQVFSSSDDRTYLNHSDVKLSDDVWDDIVKPILSGSYGRMNEESNENNFVESQIRHQTSSNYQILNSNEDTYALLSPRSRQYEIQLITEKENDNVNIIDAVTSQKVKQFSANRENQALQKLSKASSSSQKLKINADNNYVAFITDDVNEPMNYNILENNKLQLNFPKTSGEKLNQISIAAKAYLIGGLRGEVLKPQNLDIKFIKKGLDFIADVNHLPKGVYSLSISSEIKNEYKRDLINGFVISEKQNIIQDQASISQAENIFKLSNNPINETTQIISTTELKGNVNVKIYNNFGQILEDFNTSAKGTKSILIGNHFSRLTKGLYIIEVSDETSKQQFKVMK